MKKGISTRLVHFVPFALEWSPCVRGSRLPEGSAKKKETKPRRGTLGTRAFPDCPSPGPPPRMRYILLQPGDFDPLVLYITLPKTSHANEM